MPFVSGLLEFETGVLVLKLSHLHRIIIVLIVIMISVIKRLILFGAN